MKKIKSLWTIWNTPIQSDAKKVIEQNLSWDESAYALLIQFVRNKKKRHYRFTVEDFKDYCKEKGLNHPSNANKWGGLFTKASGNNLIHNTGLSITSPNPVSRNRRISVWR